MANIELKGAKYIAIFRNNSYEKLNKSQDKFFFFDKLKLHIRSSYKKNYVPITKISRPKNVNYTNHISRDIISENSCIRVYIHERTIISRLLNWGMAIGPIKNHFPSFLFNRVAPPSPANYFSHFEHFSLIRATWKLDYQVKCFEKYE